MKQLYSDAEKRVFDHWLGNSPIIDEAILEEAIEAFGVDSSLCSGITPASVVVARWLLKDVSYALPNWSVRKPDGEITFGRDHEWVAPLSHSVSVIPIHLLTINWADSAPGYSWPESYHACPMPGESKIVVTASVDSTDAYGYTDFAIGWFDPEKGLVEGAGEVIRAWWRHTFSQWDQTPWENLVSEGRIGARRAAAWRLWIWRRSEYL